jgi:hypothetical protein
MSVKIITIETTPCNKVKFDSVIVKIICTDSTKTEEIFTYAAVGADCTITIKVKE